MVFSAYVLRLQSVAFYYQHLLVLLNLFHSPYAYAVAFGCLQLQTFFDNHSRCIFAKYRSVQILTVNYFAYILEQEEENLETLGGNGSYCKLQLSELIVVYS